MGILVWEFLIGFLFGVIVVEMLTAWTEQRRHNAWKKRNRLL